MRIIIVLLLLLTINCKPVENTTEYIIVKDSTMIETKQQIHRPVKFITKIDRPCKENILRPIKQDLKIGGVSITLSDQDGDLIAAIERSSDTTEVKNTVTTKDKQHIKTTIVTKIKTPKWAWWLLGIVAGYIAYRILRLQIPFLKLLPV